MKIDKLARTAKAMHPCVFDEETILHWLSELDGQINAQVHLIQPMDLQPYEMTEDGALPDLELLVPYPYDALYLQYVLAQMSYYEGEYEKYQNLMQMYNERYIEYVKWVCENIAPADGRAVLKGYYLSAYAIAVKHGYSGSEEDWLASLVGPQGEQGPQGPAGKDAEVDATLAIEGAAADAKQTGENFRKLKDGSGTVNVKSVTAGEAVHLGKDTDGVYLTAMAREGNTPVAEIGGQSDDAAAIVRGIAKPVQNSDAANKAYVDGALPLVVEDGIVKTYTGEVQLGGTNALGFSWYQKELAEPIEEPYLNEWGYQLSLRECTQANDQPVQLYRWLYRCIQEGFTVQARTIVIIGADGTERSYACEVDGGYIDEVAGVSDAEARILNIPLLQFPNLTEAELKHAVFRVMLDNPDLCYPFWPQAGRLPCASYEGDAYGMGRADGDYLYLYSVAPAQEKREQMRSVLKAAELQVQAKAMELYGIAKGDRLSVKQKLQVAKIIHDYVVLMGHPSADDGSGAVNVYYWGNLAYAVFDGSIKALCAGYTQAFNLLARQFGIETIYISGTAYVNADGADGYELIGGHAWIGIRLSDEAYGSYPADPSKWSVIDAYWDEPVHETSIGGTPERDDILWKYFLNTSTVLPTQDDAQYAHAYRIATTTGGYGAYPMQAWKKDPSLSCPYEGDGIYEWEDLT